MKDTLRFLKSATGRKGILPTIIIAAILLTVGFGVACGTDRELNAGATRIENDGVTLSIDNGDSFDWTNVKLTLNSSYTFTISSMPAGSYWVMGLRNFAQEDGTRFNPYTMKATELKISCEQGSYTLHWE